MLIYKNSIFNFFLKETSNCKYSKSCTLPIFKISLQLCLTTLEVKYRRLTPATFASNGHFVPTGRISLTSFSLYSQSHSLTSLVPTSKVKVELATVVEGDQKAPFSIATTRCRGGRYSFPWIPLYP